jgi:hypothetical protein
MNAGAAPAAGAYDVRIELGTSLPPAGREYIASVLSRSYALSHLEWSGETLNIQLAEPADPASVRAQVARFAKLAQTLTPDVRYVHNGAGVYRDDPTTVLRARGDVTPVAPGMVALAGSFLELTERVDRYWRALAHSHTAREEEYPALWPVDLYRRIDYFREFPQQVVLAAPVHASFGEREAFANTHPRTREYTAIDSGAHLAPSTYGLQSAVCDCCYWLRRDTADQPDRWYTTAGRVFRNEAAPDSGLDRLTSFRVRDLMAVGSEAFVRAAQVEMLADAAAFLARLDLTATIETAGDPFFANDSVLKNLFQASAQLKYEMKVLLPHSGRDLAIGSVNLHQDFFGRSLGIKLPDGTPAWSACVGVGFERTAYAICCQHGCDPVGWPDLDTGRGTA